MTRSDQPTNALKRSRSPHKGTMGKEEKQRLADHLQSALQQYVERHSVALLLRERQKSELASGTCFELGGHYFIATAAHNLLNTPDEAIYVVHLDDELRRAATSILKRGLEGGGKGERLDVAYLELSRDVAVSLNRQFLNVSQLDLHGAFAPEQWTFLYGYPAELVPREEAARRTFRIKGMGLVTLAVPPTEWTRKADPECDFVFQYVERGVGPNGQSVSLPAPDGVSGGSIWLLYPNKSVFVLGAHDARWVAIQHSWDSATRHAFGNQVRWFLRLLYRDYADLREALVRLGIGVEGRS